MKCVQFLCHAAAALGVVDGAEHGRERAAGLGPAVARLDERTSAITTARAGLSAKF